MSAGDPRLAPILRVNHKHAARPHGHGVDVGPRRTGPSAIKKQVPSRLFDGGEHARDGPLTLAARGPGAGLASQPAFDLGQPKDLLADGLEFKLSLKRLLA